jgi:Wiskott-Aldrich syndrome protein
MSISSLSPGSARGVERNGSTSGLEHNPYTTLAVAGARVYHSKLNVKDSQWVYSHWKGTLTFGRDIDTPANIAQDEAEKHWFRLADDETGRTVWMFKFPEHFEYMIDRPFFHVFQGRTRRYGFLFNNDDEAALFGRKVMNQLFGDRPTKKNRSNKTGTTIRSKSLSSSISRAMISSPAPHSFKHIAHVGVNKDGLFEASKDLDGSWKTMLAELQGHGVSEAVVVRHSDFVEGFWKGVEAIRTVSGSGAERVGGAAISREMTPVSVM